MSIAPMLIRVVARSAEDARARLLLRGATRVGRGVRVFGRPDVICRGTLVVGDRAVILSTPAAVTFVVEPTGTIEIGEGACIESGAVLRARHRLVIEPGARVERETVLDDAASGETELRVPAGGEPRERGPRAPSDERVRRVLASIVPSVHEIAPDVDVRTAPGWDSLAALRAVVALERELGVSLPHDLFADARTLESLDAIARGEAP